MDRLISGPSAVTHANAPRRVLGYRDLDPPDAAFRRMPPAERAPGEPPVDTEPPTSDTTRTRRFALPDLKDPRTDEAIDALLSGAERHRGRPAREATPFESTRPFDGLEPRIAWTQALAREDARHQRYGRAASIVIFEARPLTEIAFADGWLGRVAAPIAHTIRRAARATDLITRSADTRFQVLLPETTEGEAVHFADRVIGDCGVWLAAMQAPVGVRAAASATHGDLTLEDALIRAIEALARD